VIQALSARKPAPALSRWDFHVTRGWVTSHKFEKKKGQDYMVDAPSLEMCEGTGRKGKYPA